MEEIKINVATEEAYDKAVKKAMEEFDAIGEKKDEKNGMARMIMSLQNAMFASMIRKNLFPKTEN